MALSRLTLIFLLNCILIVNINCDNDFHGNLDEFYRPQIWSLVNYLNSSPRRVYNYNYATLINAQNKDLDSTDLTIDVEVECRNYRQNKCISSLLECKGTVKYNTETANYAVLSAFCNPKSRVVLTKNEEDTTRSEEVTEAPVERRVISEIKAELEPVSEQTIIKSVGPCTGCPFDLNPNLESLNPLTDTALNHIESERNNKHILVRILRAQRQVVAGIKYILLLEIAPTNCPKTIDQQSLSSCKPLAENSQICEVTYYQRPWISRNKNIIGNNCTSSQEYNYEVGLYSGNDQDNEIDRNSDRNFPGKPIRFADKFETEDKTNYDSIADGNTEDILKVTGGIIDADRLRDLESQIIVESTEKLQKPTIEAKEEATVDERTNEDERMTGENTDERTTEDERITGERTEDRTQEDTTVEEERTTLQEERMLTEEQQEAIDDFGMMADEARVKRGAKDDNDSSSSSSSSSSSEEDNNNNNKNNNNNDDDDDDNGDNKKYESTKRKSKKYNKKHDKNDDDDDDDDDNNNNNNNNDDDSSSSSSSSSSEEDDNNNNGDNNKKHKSKKNKREAPANSSSSSSSSSEDNNEDNRAKRDAKSSESNETSEESTKQENTTVAVANNNKVSSEESSEEHRGGVRRKRSLSQADQLVKISPEEKNFVENLADFSTTTLDDIDADNHKRIVLQILGAKKNAESTLYHLTLRVGISKCLEEDTQMLLDLEKPNIRDNNCRNKLFENLTKICKVQIRVDENKFNPKVEKSHCQNIKKDSEDSNINRTFRSKRGGERLAGGVNKVDPDDPKAVEYIQTVLKEMDANDGVTDKRSLIEIKSVTRQVVSGMLWHYKITLKEDTETIECDIDVWDQPWIKPNGKQVTVNCKGRNEKKYRYKRSHYHDHSLGKDDHDVNIGMFKSFMDKYDKKYSTKTEFKRRFKIYRENMKIIKNLNDNEQGTAKYGATMFADLTRDEYKQYLGLNPSLKDSNYIPMPQAKIPEVDLPVEFDWRKKGVISEVKNQGQCGSCWAFSVTGNIEGVNAIKTGNLVELSEQELVDCDKLDSGCNGGLPDNAYRAIEELGGLETETDYPYEAENEKCHFNKSLSRVQISGAVNISSNEKDMAKWLVKNGPISIGINANAMQFYMGGVSHPWKFLCNPGNLDHGVLIVGYGEHKYPLFKKTLPYWIVKNSWGPTWGEQGYYRVYRGDGTCGVNQMASSAVL